MATETSILDREITANRGNIRGWFRQPSNWANKERLTYREVAEQVAKDKDLTLRKVEVPIDPTRPLGATRAIYQVEFDGKKVREFPSEVYEYHQSIKQGGNPKPPAEAKESWKMTKAEFKEIMEGGRELGLINQYMDETKQKAPTGPDFERIREEVAQRHPKEWQRIQRDKELKRAIYDSLPKEVKRHFGINELDESHHEAFVGQALSEGKPVPAEVLKDYPEMKPMAKVAGKWAGYSVTERVMKQLGLDRHDAVTIERALNKFKSGEDFARASGGSPASLATWAYDTITKSGRYKTVRDIEAAVAEGLGNVRVTSGEFWESIPRATTTAKSKAEAPAKAKAKIPIDYYDTLAAYYKAHGITEKSLTDKTETKGIGKKRADLVNKLMRRAEAHEKLPVGVASTERGIRQHVDNMSDRFVEDWHSTIFRKSKPHKEIAILQPKPGAKQSDRAIAIDRSLLANQVVAVDDPRWLKRPNRFDVRGVDTPSRGRIVAGVAYADKGEKRLARRHHRGWRRVKFT